MIPLHEILRTIIRMAVEDLPVKEPQGLERHGAERILYFHEERAEVLGRWKRGVEAVRLYAKKI